MTSRVRLSRSHKSAAILNEGLPTNSCCWIGSILCSYLCAMQKSHLASYSFISVDISGRYMRSRARRVGCKLQHQRGIRESCPLVPKEERLVRQVECPLNSSSCISAFTVFEGQPCCVTIRNSWKTGSSAEACFIWRHRASLTEVRTCGLFPQAPVKKRTL